MYLIQIILKYTRFLKSWAYQMASGVSVTTDSDKLHVKLLLVDNITVVDRGTTCVTWRGGGVVVVPGSIAG